MQRGTIPLALTVSACLVLGVTAQYGLNTYVTTCSVGKQTQQWSQGQKNELTVDFGGVIYCLDVDVSSRSWGGEEVLR
jgi:hypothetical protein